MRPTAHLLLVTGACACARFGEAGGDGSVGAPIYTGDDQILLLDALTFDEATPTQTHAFVTDCARLRERSRQPAQQRSGLHDRLDMSDTLYALYIALLGDGLVLDDQIQAEPLLRLHDRLLLIGEVTSSAEAWARITEALALGMGMDALQRVDLVDSVVLDDTAAYWLQEVAALLDRLLLASTMSARATITLLLPDTLITSDTATSGAEMMAQLRDALGLVMHLWLDNGHYTAWTMNTDSRASTRYTQYPFNSFMRIDGRDYAASDDGVYRLGGDSDSGRPINAHIRLGMSALGSRLAKHVPSVYLGYTTSGDLLLKVITADHGNGERRADIYRLHAKGAASPREGRVQVGRGLSAVYWDFVIENVDGADFALDVIEFMPLVVNRRLRGNAGGR